MMIAVNTDESAKCLHSFLVLLGFLQMEKFRIFYDFLKCFCSKKFPLSLTSYRGKQDV